MKCISLNAVRITALLAMLMGLSVGTRACAQTGTLGGKRIVQQVGLDQHLNEQVPLDLGFRDESGKPVRLADICNETPVILNLVYYRCPMLCTQVLNGLLEASQAMKLEMGRDYHIISVSIDPHETSAMAATKKKRYAESYQRPGAEHGWHFLTGDQPAIDRLAACVGYRYLYDPKSDQYAHASGIVILTPDGRISRYFYGIDYVPEDLQRSLVDSSRYRIATPVEQFLLLCFHYDPATGKYGFVIGHAIRLAGVITVLVMGGFLWIMFRREQLRSALEFSARPIPPIVTPSPNEME